MKKKLIATALALALTLAMSAQAFAANIIEDSVESCTVTVYQASLYEVQIPKAITLDGSDGIGSYYVLLRGSISGTETLSVVPSETVTLEQPGKSSLTAIVGQFTNDTMNTEKTQWGSDELAGVMAGAYGYIYVSEDTPMTAGAWSGTMYFTITLTDGDEEPEPEPVRTPVQTWDASASMDNSVIASLYNEDGHYSLEVTGSGDMQGYTVQASPPWRGSAYRNLIESIVIGEGVTSVGMRAFQDCSSVTSVTMSSTVTTIEGSAFSGLTSLTNLEIPRGVTSIGAFAVNGCSSLASVGIRAVNLTSVGNGAFKGMAAGSSIYVPHAGVGNLFVADTNYTGSTTSIPLLPSLMA